MTFNNLLQVITGNLEMVLRPTATAHTGGRSGNPPARVGKRPQSR